LQRKERRNAGPLGKGGKSGGSVEGTFQVPMSIEYNIYIYIYIGCPRRNVPDFGRMFLMLKYTDITQNNYIQS
jgi:hypothetical protein